MGTPAIDTIRSRSTSRSAASAFHRRMMKFVPPRRRLPGSFVMKPRCANEVPVRLVVPPPQVSPTSVCVMKDSCRFVYSAPFGVPVVPDVKMIATGRDGSSESSGTVPVWRSSARGRRSTSLTSTTATSASKRSGARLGVATTRRGAARSRTTARSGTLRRSLTPVVIAPSFAAARYAKRYSGPGGRMSATTSPSPTPRAAKPAATSSDARSTSVYEIVRPDSVT